MATTINRRDLSFLLYEFLDMEEICQRERFLDHDRISFDTVLDLAEQIAEHYFLPIAATLDENEPKFTGELVHVIPELKAAHTAYIDAGFMSTSSSYDDGGMQLPLCISQAARSIFLSTNVAAMAYLDLTHSAANMLQTWGSAALKSKYVNAMRRGNIYGTMCLSEPHAGSNLADIRTKAELQDDGSYHICGTKMWISGGDHDLSNNIAHMVLAKIPGGPVGVKGISLFLVPKLRNVEGVDVSNGVVLAGLNHKMGFRGITNALLNFGDKESSVGYLVGEVNQGLRCLFHMMNEARIGVGMGAVMLGYAGYRASLEYAKERPQGRRLDCKDPNSPQVNIIEHADVKRMLLQQKSYVEGGLSLALYCAKLQDDIDTGELSEKKDRQLLLDLLTPVVKSWPSEFCLKANEIAIQVLGGAGYTRDYSVERLYRDNRLNAIHEGTTGIQALDLLIRKVCMNQGKAFQLLIGRIKRTMARTEPNTQCLRYAGELSKACDALAGTTHVLAVELSQNVRLATANATVYLQSFGQVVIAWLWLKQALIAEKHLDSLPVDDADFYRGKLAACRYFYRYELPLVMTNLDLVKRLDNTCLDMPESSF